jgi:hypothetical protein
MISADFNGVFSEVLCLYHRETCRDGRGNEIEVREGQSAIPFELNYEDDRRDGLIATGTIARPPDWLKHRGFRWVLVIDEHGVGYESEREDIGDRNSSV